MKKIVSSFVLLLIAVSLHAEVNFMKQPEWKDVLTKAKAENKFIFVDAYTDWCSWCKVMDKNTFTDSVVSDLLNTNYVSVKMEMETGYGAVLAMKYHVSNFPTFLIFNSDGQLIDRLLGYQKVKEFMANLEKAEESPVLGGFSKEIELPYPDFYKKSFVRSEKEKKETPKDSVVLSYLAKQNDLTTEVNWSVLSRFSNVTRKYDETVLSNSSKLQALYGKMEIQKFITSIVNVSFGKAVKNKSELTLRDTVFPMIDNYMADNASKMKLDYEIAYYTQTGNYGKMMDIIADLVSRYGYKNYGSMLNSACWTIYEECKDKQLVTMASLHMKNVIDKEPEYAYIDTYAALLYKNGQLVEAEKYAGLAIEEGKKSKQDTKETEELLEKIKSGTGR